MHKAVLGFLLALVAGLMSTPADAVRCMDCASGGEWECRDVVISSNGTVLSRTSYCTYFYTAGTTTSPTGDLWFDWWDTSYGGSGRFTFNLATSIPNMTPQQYPATCKSDKLTRWLHANADVTKYNATKLFPWQRTQPDDLVKVTYDDGTWEVWKVITPTSSAQLFDIPVPGSLKGCI